MSTGIEGVLGEHRLISSGVESLVACTCGRLNFVTHAQHAAHVAEAVRERMRGRAVGHTWSGGYYCGCGHELNSPAGYLEHVVGVMLGDS